MPLGPLTDSKKHTEGFSQEKMFGLPQTLQLRQTKKNNNTGLTTFQIQPRGT